MCSKVSERKYIKMLIVGVSVWQEECFNFLVMFSFFQIFYNNYTFYEKSNNVIFFEEQL